MPLSKAQLKMLKDAYDALPFRIDLYRTQWTTARCLHAYELAGIAADGTLVLWTRTIQLIELGKSLR
jgi:hypothetical protein